MMWEGVVGWLIITAIDVLWVNGRQRLAVDLIAVEPANGWSTCVADEGAKAPSCTSGCASR